MLQEKQPNHFTVGINDDVAHLLLPIGEDFSPIPEGATQCMFWVLAWTGRSERTTTRSGSSGRTRTCTLRLLLIQHHSSGGVTVSHLRFGKEPIKSQYLIQNADYAACHIPNSVKKYKMLDVAKPESTFVMNCASNMVALEKQLPSRSSTSLYMSPQVLHGRHDQDRARGRSGTPHRHDHADGLLQARERHHFAKASSSTRKLSRRRTDRMARRSST